MSSTQNNTFFGHPKGLFYLFFAELWERFSFYGMRALLTLYMTKQLLFSDAMSFGIYAAYMSLVYVTPSIGGLVADKILGYRKAIILGGVLMMLGHFVLTVETPLFFYTALALIIVGNGLFKPNISSLVGELYEKYDTRRDSGFTIFYMGVNIGGALAPLLCAWFSEQYGWHYGFMLAGLGMIAGLLYFQRGIKKDIFGDKGLVPDVAYYSGKSKGLTRGNWVTVGAFLSVPIFAGLIYMYQYEHYLVWLVSFVFLVILGGIYRSVSKSQRQQLLVIVFFTVLTTLFWAVFEQAGSSLTLFADRNVKLVGLNAAQTNSINSAYIILLALPFSWLWSWLYKKNRNPNSAFKMGLGLVLTGAGFLIFGWSANDVDALAQTPMFYLFLGYFVLTVGEMLISPIGLAKMTELSPAKYIAFIMGIWFSSSFYGHYFAGKIAGLTIMKQGEIGFFSRGTLGSLVDQCIGLNYNGVMNMGVHFQQLYSYVSVFAGFGILTILVGIMAIVVSPLVKKMMHEVH